MHQNTNPVVIQDKNGKTTTVHRKQDSSPAASLSTLPAPSLSLSTSAPSSTDDAFRKLSELGIELSGSEFGAKNIAYLASHPKTLDAVIESIKESDEDTKKNIWEFKLGGMGMYPDDEEDNYDYRKNYWRIIKTVHLGQSLYPEKDATTRRRDIDRVVGASERGMGWWATSKKYTEVQAAMVAVVASGKLSDFEFKGRMDDIFFMADNLEKVIPLIPAILERGDTSQGYVKALMENASAPLANGLL